MAITRLERKGRKNKARAKARVANIKRLSLAPVIKNVDIEAIKASFEANASAATAETVEVVAEEKPKAPKKAAKKAEEKTEE
jgi:hypothetical protein